MPSFFRTALATSLCLDLGLGLCRPALAQSPVSQTAGFQDTHASAAPSAQQNPVPGPVGNAAVPTGPAPGEPGFATNLFSSSRSSFLGDLYGIRTKLGNYGISLGLQETSEVFGNVSGGIHRGADYDGLTAMSMGIDTEKAFGWEGGAFNISALQIHGRSISSDNLLNLQTASGIEANRATRLWEVWYQQAFLEGLVDVKIGQQSLDQEFINSAYSGLFINTMMGWPLIPSVNLFAGGPAYPLSSLGVRVRAHPTGQVTVLGGVFDDNPPGGPFYDDSQVRGAEQSGARFSLNTGALFIGEVQYALNQPGLGEMERQGEQHGLPGLYKLGMYYDTGHFPDQRFDDTGISLADPASDGNPRQHRGSYSIYAVADQMVWRVSEDGPQAVGVFARVMGAPGKQDLANFSINAGLDFKAPLPGRDDDTFGIGYGLAKLSNRVAELDQDTAALNGTYGPIRSSESFIEVTYQAQIAPWWQIQPDFQYTFTPGGGVQDPLNPAKRIGNEAIFGVRTNVNF